MSIFFSGLTIFCLALCAHVLIWKIRQPKGHTKALLQIFFGILCISLFLIWFTSKFLINIYPFSLQKFSNYVHVAIFFISLTLAYITTYSAIEVDSPSLTMILNIAKAGSMGLHRERLEQIMTNATLIEPRLKDLVMDKMIYLAKGKYRLTQRGVFFLSIFIFFRKLLNVEKGG